jgi:hypothetical protein
VKVYLVNYYEGWSCQYNAQQPKVFFKKEDDEKDKKHFEETYIGNEYGGYASITPIEAQ